MANPLAPVTLEVDTVAALTLDRNYDRVLIVRLAPGTVGTDEIYISTNGVDPTIGGAFRVMGALTESITVPGSGADQADVVKLRSAGTPTVQVEGLP